MKDLVYSFEVLSFSKKVAEMKVGGEISTAKVLRNPFLKNYREVIFEQTLSGVRSVAPELVSLDPSK